MFGRISMCPLMDGRTSLLPDQELGQRHRTCDLPALGLRVSGVRHENRRDVPPRLAVQTGTRCLTAIKAVAFEE